MLINLKVHILLNFVYYVDNKFIKFTNLIMDLKGKIFDDANYSCVSRVRNIFNRVWTYNDSVAKMDDYLADWLTDRLAGNLFTDWLDKQIQLRIFGRLTTRIILWSYKSKAFNLEESRHFSLRFRTENQTEVVRLRHTYRCL